MMKYKCLDSTVIGNAQGHICGNIFDPAFLHRSIKINQLHKEGKHFSTPKKIEYVILCCPRCLNLLTVSINKR